MSTNKTMTRTEAIRHFWSINSAFTSEFCVGNERAEADLECTEALLALGVTHRELTAAEYTN